MCNALGLIDVEPLNPKIVRIWLPVNVLFVGMLGTSFMALRTLNVAMVQGEAVGRCLLYRHICGTSAAALLRG